MAMFRYFLILLLTPLLYAQPVIGEQVIKAEELKDGEELYLGRITQGQTFQILIDPIAKHGGKFGKGGRYDIAYISNLPEGWESENASLYGNPLSVLVRVPPNAKDGSYEFLVFVKDAGNYEELPMKWFKARVDVVSNSFHAEARLKSERVGVRSPAVVKINVANDVDFGNIFEVYVKAKGFEERRRLYIAPHKEKKLVYAMSFDKEGEEEVYVRVKEVNKPSPIYEHKLTLVVEESLLSESMAIGEGIMLIPLPEAMAYYLLYLLSVIIG